MTTDIFPIYDVLVNRIFGSYGVAIIGVLVLILLILAITKTGKTFMLYWMAFYLIVMGAFYLGQVVLLAGFIIGATFFVFAIIKMLGRGD